MELQLDGVSADALFDEDKVNNGVWIHLESAKDDETNETYPLYLDPETKRQPQRALVRSHRCRAIRDAEEKLQKDGFVRVQKAKKKEKDGVIAENSILKSERRFAFFLAAVDNLSKKIPGVQRVSESDAITIYKSEAYANISQQVREAAYDDSLFLVGADTEAGPAADTATSARPTQTETAESHTT